MQYRRTKIICTIGPKTASKAQLLKLAQKGMNIARLNMSHGEHSWHKEIIQSIHQINTKHGFNIAVMLDTKGPEIRTGDVKEPIKLRKGSKIILTVRRAAKLSPGMVEVNYDHFVSDVKVGDTVLVDNGLLRLKVAKKTRMDVHCVCMNGYTLTSRRHINLPKSSLKLPAITKKDWKDIAFGVANKVDFVALSFVRKASDIESVRSFLQKKKSHAGVIAKIESHESVPRLQEIIEASDAVLIARGDLGAELPYFEVPVMQQKITHMCNELNKPVIVATHILESMIEHPSPTRAEINDLSQAVFQRADATMLSGETAIGEYPLEALKTMERTIRRMEKEVYTDEMVILHDTNTMKEELVEAASVMSTNLKVKALVVFTHSGHMALLASRSRPSVPIYGFTRQEGVEKRLQLAFGITPCFYEAPDDPEKKINIALKKLVSEKCLKKGDMVILVSDVLAGDLKRIPSVQIRTV